MNVATQTYPQWPDLDDAFKQVSAYADRLSQVFHQDFYVELSHLAEQPEAAPGIFIYYGDGTWAVDVEVTDRGFVIDYAWEELGRLESPSLEALLKPGEPTSAPVTLETVRA
jgi:hypothetical protein